ncbi:MAG TPA: hypothetical protein VN678_09330 [Acidobacteriaceae bacterium]|nr:hypothetical protein [Acidobacteriaceae bacterium]
MTEEVRKLVDSQLGVNRTSVKNHGTDLLSMLVPPRAIQVIARMVKDGQVSDETIDAWLIGQEKIVDGYRIILRDDGQTFGLASKGFPTDKHPILMGWYGSLQNTFLGM